MYKPMRDLSKMTDTISKTVVGYERIREIVDTDREVRNLPGARHAPDFKGNIEFAQVSFSYPGRESTLNNITFELKPGQIGAIVGPTGAGKTTIVSLLARFYEPTG